MSCMMLEERHTGAMVRFWIEASDGSVLWRGKRVPSRGADARIAQVAAEAQQMLIDANAASMAARYGDVEPAPQVEHLFWKYPELTAAEAVNASLCYDYHSCEAPGYEHSDAYAWNRDLRDLAARRLARGAEGWPVRKPMSTQVPLSALANRS